MDQSYSYSYLNKLATVTELQQNYTLSEAENITLAIEFQPKGNWINEDGTTNGTIKDYVFEFVKFCDVSAQVYSRNMTPGVSVESVGRPVL